MSIIDFKLHVLLEVSINVIHQLQDSLYLYSGHISADMGCCGCSPYASTITAGIFTILDLLLCLPFDAYLLAFITSEDLAAKQDETNIARYIYFIFFVKKDMKKVVIALLAIKIAVRCIWFITSIMLFVGNAKEYKKFLTCWQILTATRIVVGITTCIYGGVKLTEDLKLLFNGGDWADDNLKGLIAEFVMCLMIFVYQRAVEIESRKGQGNNQWGNFGNTSQTQNRPDPPGTGNRTAVSALAHPVSLTQEPNPFTPIREENNNKREVTTALPQKASNGYETTHSVQPILNVNEVIAIPRVTLAPKPTPAPKPTTTANQQRFDNNGYDHRNPYASSQVQRHSYLEPERNPERYPKRTASFNQTQQIAGQRNVNYNSYDNRGYQRSNQDLHQRPSGPSGRTNF
ncbi:unnamed protein product [Medioppia subpectinata]|uniref:Uncharacterized protein n=1 Tax=Medioppia subpectinata TaxID=1979941 RepID=A0A7R9KUG8_9ACAR|nr:unnamed protein product [Medioppia subpectinata]CAG2109919.1 unnamed protein product [Medioppia subpectinata]